MTTARRDRSNVMPFCSQLLLSLLYDSSCSRRGRGKLHNFPFELSDNIDEVLSFRFLIDSYSQSEHSQISKTSKALDCDCISRFVCTENMIKNSSSKDLNSAAVSSMLSSFNLNFILNSDSGQSVCQQMRRVLCVCTFVTIKHSMWNKKPHQFCSPFSYRKTFTEMVVSSALRLLLYECSTDKYKNLVKCCQ